MKQALILAFALFLLSVTVTSATSIELFASLVTPTYPLSYVATTNSVGNLGVTTQFTGKGEMVSINGPASCSGQSTRYASAGCQILNAPVGVYTVKIAPKGNYTLTNVYAFVVGNLVIVEP